MRRERRGTALGTLALVGEPEHLDRAAELALEAARRPSATGELVDVAGGRAYLKASRLRGRARARHALRGAILRSPLPRVRELENLAWLRAHGFAAPRPLAAGSIGTRFQFLLTEDARPAGSFAEALAADRALALALVAETAARLHAMGFVHRDLHPRNLLVRERLDGPELVLLDAWRGGARPQLRGPAWDLACFLADVAPSDRERAAFLERYLDRLASTRGGREPPRRARLERALDRGLRARARRIGGLADASGPSEAPGLDATALGGRGAPRAYK